MDISGDTATGFHKLYTLKQERGKLRRRESLSYWFLWHLGHSVAKGIGAGIPLAIGLAVAIIAKACNLDIPESKP